MNRLSESFSIPANHINLMLWLLIISASLIRITTPFIYNPIDALWSDPGRWWEYASTGTDTPPLALIDPVFYQAWLSFVAKLTLDIPELTALYSGLLSVITPWLWYRFLREILASKQLALTGWAILAWLPSWIGIYSYFMSETLILPLLGISFWFSARSYRRQDHKAFLLALLFWIFCSLTRAICAPMGALVLLWIWFHQKRKMQTALLAIAMVSLIFTAISFRAYERSGMLLPFGQSHLNEIYAKSGKKTISVEYYSSSDYGFIYGFGSPSIGLYPFFPFSVWQTHRDGEVKIRIDLENLAQSWQTEKQRLLSSPVKYFPLVQENLIFLFFGTSWPDENDQHLFEYFSNIMRFIWLPLFLWAIYLLAKAIYTGEKKLAPIFLAAILSWFIFQGLFLISVNEGRYRKPVEGIIICVILIYSRSRYETSSDYWRRHYRHVDSPSTG